MSHLMKRCVIEAIEESFSSRSNTNTDRICHCVNPRALYFFPYSLIFNATFLPFSCSFPPIFSQTHDIFVIIRREEGAAPWAEVCGYSPLCIMDSLRLYRVIALLEWGWGVDWGFLFSQQLLLHHQSRVTIFSSSSRCMAAALAQDGDQNLGWGVIFFFMSFKATGWASATRSGAASIHLL